MIYIDPPYNTGNNLIYRNDYIQNANDYLENSGQLDFDGNNIVTNRESNGRFHTDWLNMMYPRLRLARNLLTNDGFIVVSIDHNEVENLIKICDEIFGVENKIGIVTVVHKPEGRNQEKFFGTSNEFALFYAKNKTEASFNDVILNIEKANEFKHKDEKGKYRKKNFIRLADGKYSTREAKPNFWYPIYVSEDLKDISISEKTGYHKVFPVIGNGVERTWKTLPKTFMKLYKDGQIIAEKEDSKIIIYEKMREKEVIKTHWIKKEYHAYHYGTKVLDQLLEKKTFNFPKSVYLTIDILKLTTSSNDIVLDFFSGSATTADALMQLNAEDGNNRKFIMVQIPEPIDEKSEAYKAGYMNICEIGKERIRRAGAKIKEEAGLTAQNLDIGFRVLKLDSSNMKEVYYTPEEYSQMGFNLEGFMDNIKPDRSDEDLLFQVMLDLGIPLSAKISQEGKIFNVNDNYLIACFDKVDTAMITEIAQKQPYYAIFRDSSFINDSALVNVEQIFNTYSPSTIRRVL
jgi:adenine-specific DNA-methyltransferase